MWQGEVASLYIGPRAKEPMERVAQVRAVTGKGLEGDRYFNLQGSFSEDEHVPKREVTLIESEAIEAAGAEAGLDLDPADARRNVVTRGVPLHHLVGVEFTVGEVRLRGVKLAEPCAHLARVAGKGLLKPLIHRGGLRAQLLSDGVIRAGDEIRPASTS